MDNNGDSVELSFVLSEELTIQSAKILLKETYNEKNRLGELDDTNNYKTCLGKHKKSYKDSDLEADTKKYKVQKDWYAFAVSNT